MRKYLFKSQISFGILFLFETHLNPLLKREDYTIKSQNQFATSLFTLILFLVSLSWTAAQDKTQTSKIETNKTKIPLTLQNIDTYGLQKIILSDQHYSDFFFPDYETTENSKSLSRQKIKSQLLSNFKQYMQWQKDYDLGVFGQVLGYAQAAAAAGLAIKHIIKYKGKAFFK